MSYHIVSYCSENYSDAFDFVIESWLKTNAKRIIVYTDTDKIWHKDKRVLIIPFFEPSEDWITNVERKIFLMLDYIHLIPDIKHFAFMDIDCYIAREIGEIFQLGFDIGVTRLFNMKTAGKTASAAPWYGKMNQRTIQFVHDWANLAKMYKVQRRGIRPHNVSFIQYSFTHLLRKAHAQGGPYHVLPLDKRIWNCEDDNVDRWIQTIRQFESKVLHFKKLRFRHEKIIERAMDALK